MEVERIICAYIRMRDERSALKEKYEAQDGKIKAQMEELETYMMSLMDKQGATNIKSETGIAFFQEQTKASIADWGAFGVWCMENDGLDMLQRRVALRNLQAYLKEYDELPPGISISRERKVRIRKN